MHALRKLSRRLALTSVPLILFLLGFALLDRRPQLLDVLPLDTIRYFSLRRRYVSDSDLIFRMRPSLSLYTKHYRGDLYHPSMDVLPESFEYRVTYDDNGFRTNPAMTQADIVVLGDSFIEFGTDELDTLSANIGQRVNASTIGLGLGWYGPHHYLTLFRRYGVAYHPKVAVFCVFEGNDLDDTREYEHWRKTGTYYQFTTRPHSFLERLHEAATDTIRTFGGTRPKSAREVIHLKYRDQDIPASFLYLPSHPDVDVLSKSAEMRSLADIVQQFHSECHKRDIAAILVFIPTKISVYVDYAQGISGGRFSPARRSAILQSRTHLAEAVRELSKDIGITFVDLGPSFRDHNGEMLYYPFDSHWNSNGRQLAADILVPTIVTLCSDITLRDCISSGHPR